MKALKQEKAGRPAWLPSLLCFVPLVLTVCVGVAVSIALFAISRRSEWRKMRAHFESQAQEHTLAVERTMETKILFLESIRTFYEGSQEVEPEEFRTFVGPSLARLKGVQAIEWAPRVADAQRETCERSAREAGIAGFQITERDAGGSLVRAAHRAEHFPVRLVEPREGNQTRYGFDLASDEGCRAALASARDTGEMAAASPVALTEQGRPQAVVSIFVPVYRKGAPTDSAAARHESIEGVIAGIFHLDEVVEHAFSFLE